MPEWRNGTLFHEGFSLSLPIIKLVDCAFDSVRCVGEVKVSLHGVLQLHQSEVVSIGRVLRRKVSQAV